MLKLTGSDKQIKWASDLRTKRLAEVEELSNKPGANEFDQKISAELKDYVENKATTSWLIEYRDDALADIWDELVSEELFNEIQSTLEVVE
jgi:hypothetical protein